MSLDCSVKDVLGPYLTRLRLRPSSMWWKEPVRVDGLRRTLVRKNGAPGSKAGIASCAYVIDPIGSVATWAALSRSSSTMIRKSVAEILDDHVTFELEAIDRMYLNAYVPALQTGGGFVYFVKNQLGAIVPSTHVVAPLSERLVAAIEQFVKTEEVDLVTFEKH